MPDYCCGNEGAQDDTGRYVGGRMREGWGEVRTRSAQRAASAVPFWWSLRRGPELDVSANDSKEQHDDAPCLEDVGVGELEVV